MSLIERDQLLTMLPHAGSMCLLDAVLAWHEGAVRCLSRRYRDRENPLRRADGVLGAACGIEIAAQAMAVHGRLISGESGEPPPGYLVSLRDVKFHAQRLDAIDGDLVVDATRLTGEAQGASYRFVLSVQNTEILSGRATVLFAVSA
jgi:predicted hotdog family 3-hydroxylacyl-ACP dehydratase